MFQFPSTGGEHSLRFHSGVCISLHLCAYMFMQPSDTTSHLSVHLAQARGRHLKICSVSLTLPPSSPFTVTCSINKHHKKGAAVHKLNYSEAPLCLWPHAAIHRSPEGHSWPMTCLNFLPTCLNQQRQLVPHLLSKHQCRLRIIRIRILY